MPIFEVQALSTSKQVDVIGETLGHLRTEIKQQFGIPNFEQKIIYDAGTGVHVPLDGDDTVLLKEKKGLLDTTVLVVVRQVDPRFKMEKETAFLEALAAGRYSEAKEVLVASGVTIDPNCVHKHVIRQRIAVTECPRTYRHPALTVAMMAGIEEAVRCLSCVPDKINAFVATEGQVSELVGMLIERKADVNANGEETQDCESAGCPTVHNKTPLCAAVQRGSPTLVKMLLDAKADPNHAHKYDQSAWGPDRNNPFGPGQLRPESWMSDVSNGSVSRRNHNDPRNAHNAEILELLRAASSSQDDSNL